MLLNLKIGEYFTIALVLLAAPLLLFINASVDSFLLLRPFEEPKLNHILNYQIVTFILALLYIGYSLLLNRDKAQEFLKPGKTDAPFVPVPVLGITAKKGENWLQLGIYFSIVITLVTGLVIYFQNVAGKLLILSLPLWMMGLLAVGFALFNSFTEEALFRFALVSGLDGKLSPIAIAVMSGAIFGFAHYFGSPGGVPGVLMAGFIGWFLAKSMLETRGFFWAWFIHFLQDVLIFLSFMLVL